MLENNVKKYAQQQVETAKTTQNVQNNATNPILREPSNLSIFEETIMQNGEERIDLNLLSESYEYSVGEYQKLLNNPILEKEDFSVLDIADGDADDAITKESIEKLTKVCDLVEKFQNDPENEMVQYINRCANIEGEDFLNNITFSEKNGKSEITLSDGENYISFDVETSNVTKCSAANPWGIIPGTIIGAFDGDTKDGKIGNTEQGATGDCWVLSGINALSYTEEGREVIENALEYHDGYTIVHLATGDYVVKDSEVTTTKGSSQYSDGDDDMIILELAIEKALDDIASGKVELKEGAPWYLTNDTDENGNREKTRLGHSAATGGWANEVWYLLTGKESSAYDNHSSPEAVEQILDEYQQNGGEDIALAASITSLEGKDVEGLEQKNGSYYITDVNGNEHQLGEGHAYAIKSVTDDTVTITNPWDSSKEIVLTKEQYMALFDKTRSIDLDDSNKEKDYTTYNVTDENGNTQNYEDRRIEYDDKGNVKWVAYDDVDENGNPITAFDTDGDGVIDQYYKDGEYINV